MKRKTAKELIADSLRELAEKKSVDKITVREIAENCGYSPATFYRNFRDKYDVIAWDYARRAAGIMENAVKTGYSWRQICIDGLEYYRKEREYIVNLLVHTGGHDSFIRYMTETHFREMSSCLRKLAGVTELDRQTEMSLRLYCMGTACFNCEWLVGNIDATMDEVADIYEKSVPEPIRALLFR